MLRSAGAVVAGYFVFAMSGALLFQLTGADPHLDAPLTFKIACIVWGAVFALVAGWLAAHVAVKRPAAHAGVVAVLIAAGAIASLVSQPGTARWTQISAIVVMAPCAWLGGVLAASRRARL